MKKILLSVMFIAAMVMLVSCGSEEYKKGSSIMKEATQKVKKAKTCDELEKAMDAYHDWIWDDPISETSESEDKKLDKQEQKLLELCKAKEKELCNNDESFDFDGDDDDEEEYDDDDSSSEDWDKILDDYESLMDSYIRLAKKAKEGDMSAMSEYSNILQKTQSLSRKMENASTMTPRQIERYTKIQTKFAEAAATM